MANSNATFNLNVVNPAGSGVSSDNIYISILGTNPSTGVFSYLDISTGSLVAFSSYQSGVTSQVLSDITSPIGVPAMKSARIYFAIGQDFDSTSFPASSGPSASKGQTVMFDKIEFDTSSSGSYNINPTNVDFYSFSFIVSLENQQGQSVTVGLTSTRTTVMTDFGNIPQSTATNSPGNTSMYQQLFVADQNNNIVRFIAPKSAALTDWGNTSPFTPYGQQYTHYLDSYVNNEVFAANRTFSFYDKFYPAQKNEYYGKVSGDGSTVSLYTDPGMTNLYLTLGRPSNTWGNPDLLTYFHNTSGTVNDNIDWGFLLMGNVNGTGLAANWGSDPAAMAIMISICRGVAHMNDGTTSWVNSDNYYQGDGGTSTENFPIEFYSKIIHANAPAGQAYALSYDDIYGQNPSVFFNSGQEITVSLNSLEAVPMPQTMLTTDAVDDAVEA